MRVPHSDEDAFHVGVALQRSLNSRWTNDATTLRGKALLRELQRMHLTIVPDFVETDLRVYGTACAVRSPEGWVGRVDPAIVLIKREA